MNDIVHSHSVFPRFSALGVKHAIDKLKMGTSAGSDSMQGEQFTYADYKVTGLLSMLFNSIFLHNYLPCKLMEPIIVLIIKNKKGLIKDKDNYRPIAITSVVWSSYCWIDYSFSWKLLVISLDLKVNMVHTCVCVDSEADKRIL